MRPLFLLRRCLATVAEVVAERKQTNPAPLIFDRQLHRQHKERCAYNLLKRNDEVEPAFVGAVTQHLLDRLEDTTRAFKRVLLLGNFPTSSVKRLQVSKAGIEEAIFVDPSCTIRHSIQGVGNDQLKVTVMEGDDEDIPVDVGSVDLVVSNLGMHWINDLQGALLQCRLALRPDGLFLGTMIGGTTLQEFRTCLALAEQERRGGVSPRVSPLVQVSDAGQLLTDSGFKLTSVDVDNVVMKFTNAWELVQYMRMMGESNACIGRQELLDLNTALSMSSLYDANDAKYRDAEGWIRATFQVIYMTGWSPGPKQQKPAARGSADISLEELDGFSRVE